MERAMVRAKRSNTPGPLDWAASALGDGEDILRDVKGLWLDMQLQRVASGLSLDLFTAMLETDSRFDLLPEADQDLEDASNLIFVEELGFSSGPYVKLANRELTPAYMARLLQHSTQAMLDALEGAWAARPDDDPEAEQQLLQVLTLAEQLKHEVDGALASMDGEDEPGG